MNAPKIRYESGAHWYGQDGSAQHDADLRVARKQLLYPSVTTIDKEVFKNQGLERYKIEQIIAAATHHPRQPHETDDGYANRIYQLSLEHSAEAAGFGKVLHDAFEDYPQMPLNQEIIPWVEKFSPWYEAHVDYPIAKEKVLIDHELGVAGRCDFVGMGKGVFNGKVILPDYKTQDVKKDEKGRKKPAFYPSWVRQLSFYAVSFAKEAGSFPGSIPTAISIVIDSNEPETPFVKVWSPEEIRAAYETFVVGAWLWFSGSGNRKPFWPQKTGQFRLNPTLPMPYE